MGTCNGDVDAGLVLTQTLAYNSKVEEHTSSSLYYLIMRSTRIDGAHTQYSVRTQIAVPPQVRAMTGNLHKRCSATVIKKSAYLVAHGCARPPRIWIASPAPAVKTINSKTNILSVNPACTSLSVAVSMTTMSSRMHAVLPSVRPVGTPC